MALSRTIMPVSWSSLYLYRLPFGVSMTTLTYSDLGPNAGSDEGSLVRTLRPSLLSDFGDSLENRPRYRRSRHHALSALAWRGSEMPRDQVARQRHGMPVFRLPRGHEALPQLAR